MAGKVVGLHQRGRPHAVAEAIQLALELPLDLSQATRDELAEVLGRYEPAERWNYTMISSDRLRELLKAINACKKPAITLRVWTAVVSHIMRDTGEIMASQARLAEDAGTTVPEVSRAMRALAEMGALKRLRPGRYMVHPAMAWSGSLAKREAAAAASPPLTLLQGGAGKP